MRIDTTEGVSARLRLPPDLLDDINELGSLPGAAVSAADTALGIGVAAVVGLGYVGLPLAVEFGRRVPTIGFDVSEAKIAAYLSGVDPAREVAGSELPE